MIKTILGVVASSALSIIFSCTNSNDDRMQSHPEQNSKESLKNAIREYPDSLMMVQDLIELYRNEGAYDSALTLTDTNQKRY